LLQADKVYLDGFNGFLIENETACLTKKIIALMLDHHAIKTAGEGARKSIFHPWESIINDVYFRYVESIKTKHHNHSVK